MLARQNGWDECADALKTWVLNKDRDLREREGPPETDDPAGVPPNRFTSHDRRDSAGEGESSTRRRIHMKRSMDTALSMLKGPSEVLKPPLPSVSTSNLQASASSTLTPPPSPGMKPFGEYTFYPVSPTASPIDPGSRRPSLPQISYPTQPHVNRKTSLATRGNPRRPRSAGNGAEGEGEAYPSFGRGGAGRKLGSKYSLLNMFKKEGTASGAPLERTGTQQSTSSAGIPSASALSSSSSVVLPSAESSPGPPSANLADPSAPFMRRPPNMSPSSQSQQLPAMQKSPPRPPIPLAVDLHNALAQHQHRDRSGSGASAPFDPGMFMGGALNEGGSPASQSSFTRLGVYRPTHVRDRSGSRGSSAGNRSGSIFDDDFVVTGDAAGKSGRPGILRAHNRSSSNGPSPPPAVRALRFDPASGGSKPKGDESPGRSGSALGLRGSTSAGSLSRLRNEATGNERELPDSAPAAVQDFDLEALETTFMEDDDEDEYAYGRPLPNSRLAILAKAARSPISHSDPRPNVLSLTSSSQSSFSPPLDADPTVRVEFPFSIHEPPPIPVDPKVLRDPSPLDNRGRGDSVSSTSTTESQINPQMSVSGTTSGSGSVTVTTPLQAPEVLAASPEGSPLPLQAQLEGEGEGESGSKLLTTNSNRLNERRTHTPLDINLSLISSHAQAEALVQKELQDILEMPVVSTDSKAPGWTPLSARLAAYGESLELERKFRQDATSPTTPVDQEDTPTDARAPRTATSRSNLNPRRGHNGVDRQNSLDIRPTPSRKRPKEPRRPHTSSGTDSPSTECMFFLNST
jgi:hypothetical protein